MRNGKIRCDVVQSVCEDSSNPGHSPSKSSWTTSHAPDDVFSNIGATGQFLSQTALMSTLIAPPIASRRLFIATPMFPGTDSHASNSRMTSFEGCFWRVQLSTASAYRHLRVPTRGGRRIRWPPFSSDCASPMRHLPYAEATSI